MRGWRSPPVGLKHKDVVERSNSKYIKIINRGFTGIVIIYVWFAVYYIFKETPTEMDNRLITGIGFIITILGTYISVITRYNDDI